MGSSALVLRSEMDGEGLKAVIADLLRNAGLGGLSVVWSVGGGGNNQTYAVKVGGQRYLAKVYYSNRRDRRDRLGAEYGLLSYAKGAGINSVPAPIACDREKNIGIYEFIEGVKLAEDEVKRCHVLEAARFVAQLNADRDKANGMGIASEACFSGKEHIGLVNQRVLRLKRFKAPVEISGRVQRLVNRIIAAWEERRACIGYENIPSLADRDRCISPSDFGFHNALLTNNGKLCFIDFEYAGWDDPAKMIGDFFCQPSVPIPIEYLEEFAAEAFCHFKSASALLERARLLLPAIQIKWCCILLNEFLSDAAERRRFANFNRNEKQRQMLQLEKAEKYFKSKLE
jgi:hypothetical protein